MIVSLLIVVVVGAVVGICVRSNKDDVGTAVIMLWEGKVVVGSLVAFAEVGMDVAAKMGLFEEGYMVGLIVMFPTDPDGVGVDDDGDEDIVTTGADVLA